MVDIRWVVIVCGFLGFLSATTPARADDRAECNVALPDRRIVGCTRLIETEGLKPADRARAYLNRGRGYLSKPNSDRLAVSDFQQARKLVPPDSSDAALTQGFMEIAQRQFQSAIPKFDEAIKRDPKNVLAYVGRGAAHRLTGQHEPALADYETAIRLDPASAAGFSGRGTLHGIKKDFERAIADFDMALKIDATDANTLRLRGLAKSDLQRFDDAIVDYDAVIRIDPFMASAYNGRGFAYSKKGDPERAFADYDAAVRIDPNLIVALNNRGIAFTKRGDAQQAMADFERVLALPPVNADDRGRIQVARERLARLKAAALKQEAGDSAPTSRHKRVALVIGNGRYTAVAALPNPTNDAKAMAAALRRLGFGSVIEVFDATHADMIKALKDFGDASEGAEWAVVFFAGHGMEMNGTSYLIPIDAQLKRDNHVADEAVALSRVQAKVDAASKIGLIILDSCRNNPFASRMVRSAGATRSAIGNGLAPVEPDGNVIVFYAAKHGSVAEDGTGTHSPFTEALLAHIEHPGVELRHLLGRVRDVVRRKTDRRQDPFHYGSLGEEQYYFNTASR